jgi:hypothetical protein
MIEERQKKIYNSFLRASRASKNKPFTQRQNFDNITSTVEVALKKLDSFFASHPTVRYYDFFIAPYSIYKDQEFFDLRFYTTMKALKCYTEYIKQLEYSDSDSDIIIERCKECCINIYKFCKEQNITLQEYKTQQAGTIPLYIQHLKEHKINFYTLHGLEVNIPTSREDVDIFRFMFEDFSTTFNNTRSRFIRSTRLKKIVRAALIKIEEKLLISDKGNIL